MGGRKCKVEGGMWDIEIRNQEAGNKKWKVKSKLFFLFAKKILF